MKKRSRAFISYSIITLLYLLLVIVLPANKVASRQYHLTGVQYHVLLLFVTLPLAAVWFAAFYGYAKLRSYADSIEHTSEGADFDQLASGVTWLAWGLPATSIISLCLNSIADNHRGFHSAANIINNYCSLLIALIAFSFISNGSRGLLSLSRQKLSLGTSKGIIMLFVLLGVVYCFLTFRHIDLRSVGSTNNPYYLPDWIIVLTIIIPYLYAWLIGLLAAYEIAMFGKQAKGLLYGRPSKIMAGGFTAVIAGSIALQYLTSVIPRSGHLSLNLMLVTTYAIRFVSAVGFILIAAGASRLRRIEEV